MDDTQRILKCGNLSLHTPGGFFKKRWHRKYLVLYDGSKSGVKRLELFDSEIKFKKQNPAKIIPLVDCVRVVTCQRNKSTYTFEVRTSDQFYLLAAQSFQDMNDWVNCLRLVAFGQCQPAGLNQPALSSQPKRPQSQSKPTGDQQPNQQGTVDVLLDQKVLASRGAVASAMGGVPSQPAGINANPAGLLTAGQAAAAAASALAKTRQRQPSLLGACKPLPPTDSPFISQQAAAVCKTPQPQSDGLLGPIGGQLDTMTPTVRGQLIAAANGLLANRTQLEPKRRPAGKFQPVSSGLSVPASLDEEEENMLYCSIEDNPSEHNYRVKVIETELSLRCQLKCYQLTAPTTISQQYEQFGRFNQAKGQFETTPLAEQSGQLPAVVNFYQLIIGPQQLTLLNDYAAVAAAASASNSLLKQQQGLWSWPYQCIRRYGFDKDNCFMFEAGRKCTSGPGQFIVQTPKAYQIYQDVVKFVNELRSLTETGTIGSEQVPSALPKPNAQHQVTQIPVTWAPVVVPPIQQQQRQQAQPEVPTLSVTELNQDPGSRAQFFDALRQLDSTVSSHSTQIDRKQNDNQQQQVHVETIRKLTGPEENPKKVAKSATPEETDESGYEQGDESVDSSVRPANKLPTAQLIKRLPVSKQASSGRDSMSSASSTSSSGAGSPGHSVGRRSGNSLEGATITRRPAIDTNTKTSEIRNDSLLTSRLLGAAAPEQLKHDEDFEANLIRDVYSEITKLHAKFAVVNGSGDDSMSSNSSSSSFSGTTSSNDLQELHEQQHSGPRIRRKGELAGEYHLDPEPMYTNLNAPTHHINSYPSNPSDYLYNASQRLGIPSNYPSVLNPIPEEERPPKVAPKPVQLSCYPANRQNPPPSETKSGQLSDTFNNNNNKINNNSRANIKPINSTSPQRQPQLLTAALNKSKHPTNHYVINDVQYAKISRNIRKNFESFL